MGLDMYLTAEKYFWHNDKKPRIGGIPKGFEVKTVTVDAAYWRKANHIHAWFVKNVQNGVDNCQAYDVAHSDLMKLHKVCVDTLSNRHNAERDLPTQSGFFFGGTEYDDWYFSSLEDTIEKIEKVLESFDFKIWSLTYRSSW